MTNRARIEALGTSKRQLYSRALWLVPTLLALGAIGYVYRFPIGIGNASLFRLNGLIVGAILAIRLLIGGRRWATGIARRTILPFCLVGAITLVAVGESALRIMPAFYTTDSIVQTINGAIFILIFVFIDSRMALLRVIRAYIVVSFLEAGIAIEALLSGRLLLSGLIHREGATFYSGLSLVNQSDGLRRLTGTLFDPNFYGIYL